MLKIGASALLSLALIPLLGCTHIGDGAASNAIDERVQQSAAQVMAEHEIPGMAIAVSNDGQDRFYEFGVMDPESDTPVTENTLFELGSISKLFTVVAATSAEQDGKLSLQDPISSHVPELADTELGAIPLFHLATHTAGGFPLQVPSEFEDQASLYDYFRSWEPESPTGTQRHYANPSIGLLGVAVSNAIGIDFQTILEQQVFPDLEMRDSYVAVPESAQSDYAWGMNRRGERVRVNPGMLADEAYGVKSSSSDLLRFLKANLNANAEDTSILRAVRRSHHAYFNVGPFEQALIWERYAVPVDLSVLSAGNSYKMILEPAPVTETDEQNRGSEEYALSKTGSTGGFGAYVLTIPSEKFAIVILANRNYPIGARIELAHGVMNEFLEVE